MTALANPERYEGGEEPREGDVVEDRAGLFLNRRRVLGLGHIPGITDADLVCWISEWGGWRTPATLRLVERRSSDARGEAS